MLETQFTAFLEPSNPLNPRTFSVLNNGLNKLSIPFSPYQDSIFNIEYIKKENFSEESLFKNIGDKQIFGINNIESFKKKDLLKITCSIKFDNTIPQSVHSSWNEQEKIFYNDFTPTDFNLAYIYDIMKKRIQDLIFAFNLTNNGILSINKYLFFQDNNNYIMAGTNLDYSIFSVAFTNLQSWKYPPIKTLDFEKTWNWIIQFDDFLEGYSQSSTTRALLNLFEIPKVDENMKLFRAIMGIEALYTEGNSGLMKQVQEKSRIILGEQESFKSLYKNMYSLRSKYIHGELDFISSVYTSTNSPKNNFNSELKVATSFAILVLYSSIQVLIEKDWTGFEFSSHWKVKEVINKKVAIK